MFLAKQPNFFKDDNILYATFPGVQTTTRQDVGHWLSWCPSLSAVDRAMAFQVFCHAISHFKLPVCHLAILDANSIRFYTVPEYKSDLHMLLRSTWNGQSSFIWKWVDDYTELPARAKWIPHPGAQNV